MMRGLDFLDYVLLVGAFGLLGLSGLSLLMGLWRMRSASDRLLGASQIILAFLIAWGALTSLMTTLKVRPPLLFYAAWCVFGLLVTVAVVGVIVLYTREWYANRQAVNMAPGES